jgi:hypothetical protein
LQDEKNNKKDFMPEILGDVNQSHRKTVGWLMISYNYLKLNRYVW